MRVLLSATAVGLAAMPVQAASTMPIVSLFNPSLSNTDFVVFLAFLVFIGVLIWKKVPALLTKLLDDRAEGIEAQLSEARALRDEAQALLASFERRQREAEEQAKIIVENARAQAEADAENAKKALEQTIGRRVHAAEERITAAQTAAVKQVRDQAVEVAIKAVAEASHSSLKSADANTLIETSIKDLSGRFH